MTDTKEPYKFKVSLGRFLVKEDIKKNSKAEIGDFLGITVVHICDNLTELHEFLQEKYPKYRILDILGS